jgi:thiol-disulfide isomerase/thioredoxin
MKTANLLRKLSAQRVPIGRHWGVMLSGLTLLLIVGAACATAATPAATDQAASAEAVEETDPIDGFQLTLFGNENHEAGSTLNLSDHLGKPVVLNFWYPSCPPCRLEMPDLEAASRKHAANGVEFIGIMSLVLDTVADGQDFIDEFGITYAIGPDSDGSILIDNKVIGFPTTIFLNADHEVVRKWAGILDAEKLDELIAESMSPAEAVN